MKGFSFFFCYHSVAIARSPEQTPCETFSTFLEQSGSCTVFVPLTNKVYVVDILMCLKLYIESNPRIECIPFWELYR